MWLLIILVIFLALVATVYMRAFKKAFVRGPFTRFGHKSLLIENKNEHWEDLKKKGRLWREGMASREVKITSHDGLTLVGSLYENPKGKGVFLLFHGYRSNPIKDFDCILEKYYNLGYSLLVPDQRAHGRSEGKYITYGILERFDCKGWVEFAKELYGDNVPIYLDGLSMGATTVLMAAGLNIEANIRGVISDSAFSSPVQIIDKVGHEDLKLPRWLFLPQMKLLCRTIARFDPDATSTFEALKNTDLPILFVHGTADELVPYDMVKQHCEIDNFKRELVSVEGATHAFGYIVDTPLVERKLYAFIERTE